MPKLSVVTCICVPLRTSIENSSQYISGFQTLMLTNSHDKAMSTPCDPSGCIPISCELFNLRVTVLL